MLSSRLVIPHSFHYCIYGATYTPSTLLSQGIWVPLDHMLVLLCSLFRWRRYSSSISWQGVTFITPSCSSRFPYTFLIMFDRSATACLSPYSKLLGYSPYNGVFGAIPFCAYGESWIAPSAMESLSLSLFKADLCKAFRWPLASIRVCGPLIPLRSWFSDSTRRTIVLVAATYYRNRTDLKFGPVLVKSFSGARTYTSPRYYLSVFQVVLASMLSKISPVWNSSTTSMIWKESPSPRIIIHISMI